MGDLIVFILVGLVIGIIARALMPGPDPIGIIGTIVVGIAGALIGGYLWRAILSDTEGLEWIGSILVAMALLWIYRRMTYNRRVV